MARRIVSAFDAYVEYLALVRHFTSDGYDYEQFNGKTRARRSTFEKRRDQFWFDKIAAHHDPSWLMIATLVENPHAWVGEIARASERYARRKGRIESLEYVLRRELETVGRDPVVELAITGSGHPALVRRVLSDEVSLESAAVISIVTGCGPLWKGVSDPVIRDVGRRLVKYSTFVPRVESARDLVRDHFRDYLRRSAIDTAA